MTNKTCESGFERRTTASNRRLNRWLQTVQPFLEESRRRTRGVEGEKLVEVKKRWVDRGRRTLWTSCPKLAIWKTPPRRVIVLGWGRGEVVKKDGGFGMVEVEIKSMVSDKDTHPISGQLNAGESVVYLSFNKLLLRCAR